MFGFIFSDNINIFKNKDAFSAYLSLDIHNKSELLKDLNKKLEFPYFGFNWDALDECLNDFHWIKKFDIYLIHSNFPALADEDLEIYFTILKQAVLNWKENPFHNFFIVFEVKDQKQVEKFLKE